MIQPLTLSQIFRAESKKTKYSLADGHGLHLLIQPTGSKSWQLRYQNGGGRKYLSLGCFPEVSLAHAREMRQEVRIMLARGVDPRTKVTGRGAISFEAVARQWFDRYKTMCTERHTALMWTLLGKEVFPYIGHHPVTKITAPAVLAILRRIENRSLGIAHKVKNLCSQVFRFAVASGYADGDPMVSLVGALPAVRHKPFEAPTDPKDVASLLNPIDGYRGSFVVRCAMKLAPLLMVRPGELCHAEWKEIDFANEQWVIPAEKMMWRRPHLVPLSRQAVSILRELQGHTGDGRYVFPRAKSPDRCICVGAVNAAFRNIGLKMSSYCCRVMAERIAYEVLGFSVETVERQLARTAAVDRLTGFHGSPLQYLEQRRDMMQKLADYLDAVKGAAMVTARKS